MDAEKLLATYETAFAVAKMTDARLLKDVRAAVDNAIAEGQSLRDFRARTEQRLSDGR